MKKRELITFLQGIPDDTEIVIGPYHDARYNRRLQADDITFVREPRDLPPNVLGHPYGDNGNVIHAMDDYLIIHTRNFI